MRQCSFVIVDHRYVIVHTKYSHEVYAKRPQELYFFVLIGSEVYSIVTYLHSETYMMAIVTTRMRSSHKNGSSYREFEASNRK